MALAPVPLFMLTLLLSISAPPPVRADDDPPEIELHFTRRGIEYKFVQPDEIISGLLDALPDAAPNPYLNKKSLRSSPSANAPKSSKRPH